MPDKGEMVIIEMLPGDRMRLDQQINDQMEKAGLGRYAYDKLNHLPANWPGDINSEITLAQLTVLAQRLKMRIIINDLSMVPLRETGDDGESGSL